MPSCTNIFVQGKQGQEHTKQNWVGVEEGGWSYTRKHTFSVSREITHMVHTLYYVSNLTSIAEKEVVTPVSWFIQH